MRVNCAEMKSRTRLVGALLCAAVHCSAARSVAQPVEETVPAAPVTAPAATVAHEPVPGDRVLLVFLDGQRVEGEFVRGEPGFAVVKVSNVETPFERTMLSQIMVVEPPAEQFRRLRGAIKDSDIERRIDLSEWARENGMYDEGLAEAEGVLQIDPGHADALRLRAELSSLIRLRGVGSEASPKPARAKPASPTRPALDEFPLLTPEQVNRIKVFEVDLKDPPKITISRETVDRLLTRYADHPLIPTSREAKDGFRALPAETILETMFKVRARDLYDEVRVVDNPASMKKFRDRVHSAWLVNNCATTRCHGGSAAGRLLLTNRRPNADDRLYTNFLIIDRFKTTEGRTLINWGEPERSVLLQMGLPREDAITPHPEVKGWSPAFRTRDDRRFRQAVEWMQMMYRPRPDYGVVYPARVSGEPHEAADPGVPAQPER